MIWRKPQLADIILLDLGLYPDANAPRSLRKFRPGGNADHRALSRDAKITGRFDRSAGRLRHETLRRGGGIAPARMQAALRHANRPMMMCWRWLPVLATFGDLSVDHERRQVFVSLQNELHLTPIEYKLLKRHRTVCRKVMTHRSC